jgi:hypothetical protein
LLQLEFSCNASCARIPVAEAVSIAKDPILLTRHALICCSCRCVCAVPGSNFVKSVKLFARDIAQTSKQVGSAFSTVTLLRSTLPYLASTVFYLPYAGSLVTAADSAAFYSALSRLRLLLRLLSTPLASYRPAWRCCCSSSSPGPTQALSVLSVLVASCVGRLRRERQAVR